MRIVFMVMLIASQLLRAPVVVDAQTLTETEIEQAIQAGLSDAKDTGSLTFGSVWKHSFWLRVAGPFGRVAAAAAAAKAKKQAFTRANVSAEMLLPVWEFAFYPRDHTASEERGDSMYIQRKVPKGASPSARIEPVHQVSFSVPMYIKMAIAGDGPTVYGEKRVAYESRGVLAHFEPATLPADDFEAVLVVIAKGALKGERSWESRFTVSRKDRTRIR